MVGIKWLASNGWCKMADVRDRQHYDVLLFANCYILCYVNNYVCHRATQSNLPNKLANLVAYQPSDSGCQPSDVRLWLSAVSRQTDCQPSDSGCQPSDSGYQPSAYGCQPSAVSRQTDYQPSAISRQTMAVSRQLSDSGYQPSAVRLWPSAVSRQPVCCRYTVKVTEDHLVSIQMCTSKRDVFVKLAVLDREEEVASSTGKAHVVIPAFIFLSDGPAAGDGDGDGDAHRCSSRSCKWSYCGENGPRTRYLN